MADESTAAPWIVTAIVTAGAVLRDALRGKGKHEDVLTKLIEDCEKRHDERDGEVRELRNRVEGLAVKHAQLAEAHKPCGPAIAALRREVRELRDTQRPPAMPVMHEEVGDHGE